MKTSALSPSKKLRRKAIAQTLRLNLLEEVRFVCPNPECKVPSDKKLSVRQFEIHHIDGDRSNSVAQNLIALCRNCHKLADSRLISEADLNYWKLSLVNRVHPRLGGEAERSLQTQLAPEKPPNLENNFTAGNISGGTFVQAGVVNLNVSKTPTLAPAPDSIAAHAAAKSYVAYLREKYIWCRLQEEKMNVKRQGKPFAPSASKNIMTKIVGFAPLQAPVSAMTVIEEKMIARICKTPWARKIGYRPHSWEEHQHRFS